MYYEYHLENDMVIKSEKPYVDGFWLYLEDCEYDPWSNEYYEVESFVKVRYCLIKDGTIDESDD
jgi:hypothetical protein